MRYKAVIGVTWVTLMQLVALRGQPATPPRLLEYSDTRPIVEMLKRGEPHVHVWQTVFHAPEELGDKSLAEVIEADNPVILIARVEKKAPAFMQFHHGFDALLVSMNEATWIGSWLTLHVERVVKAPEKPRIVPNSHLTAMIASDGSAVIDGTRVDTETSSAWPVEQGKRYLVTGTFTRDPGAGTERFDALGMYLESADGSLHGRRRDSLDAVSQSATVPAFGSKGSSAPNVNQVADELEQIASKRKQH